MFTQADRKMTGSAGRLVTHYFHKSNEGWSPDDPQWHPDNNDRVEVLHGESVDLKLWDKYASANAKKYGVREYVLSPNIEMSESQALRMAEVAMEIIDADQHHDFVLVAHHKKRVDGSEAPHYHLLVNEVSFETGKVLSSKERNQRCQLISRLVEYEFGLDPEPRSYDDWVVNRLREMGRAQVANDIERNLANAAQFKIITDIKSNLKPADFSTREHQRAKRLGVDLAAVRHELRETAGNPAAVAAVLVDLEAGGFTVEKGRKGNVILIEKNGWRKSIQRVSGLDDKTDFYSAFVELKSTMAPATVREMTGLDKVRRAVAAERVSGRMDAIISGIDTARGPAKPTGLQKLRRGAVAQKVSRRLDSVMDLVLQRRRPTGLQKLRRGAVARAVAGRLDGIMSQIHQPNGSAPVAMYMNDNDPQAWQIRMQQWSESMQLAQPRGP